MVGELHVESSGNGELHEVVESSNLESSHSNGDLLLEDSSMVPESSR